LTIGRNIRDYRKQKRLTQKQLAELAGVASITISQYEIGRRQPKISQLEKIANALGASVDDLISDTSHLIDIPNQVNRVPSLLTSFLTDMFIMAEDNLDGNIDANELIRANEFQNFLVGLLNSLLNKDEEERVFFLNLLNVLTKKNDLSPDDMDTLMVICISLSTMNTEGMERVLSYISGLKEGGKYDAKA